MKKLFNYVLIVLAFCTMATAKGSAQEIKPAKPTPQDYIELLNSTGYEAFTFDISDFLDKKYMISFKIREYGPDLINDDFGNLKWFGGTRNITYLKDFNEEAQARVKPEDMYDQERGIIQVAKKILIGSTPAVNDSIIPIVMQIENQRTLYQRLEMKPLYTKNDSINGKKFYSYYPRPFILKDIKMGEFIPLVLFGSVWWDEEFNVHRFCGDNEIDPDLSTEILKHIPHYYIIGVVIKPAE